MWKIGYAVEILPLHSRQKLMGLCYIGNSCANLFNSLVSPIALDAIGWKYYLVYVAMLVQFLAAVYFFFPETRGYPLESISELFEDTRLFLGKAKVRPESDVAIEEKATFKAEVEMVENVDC